MCVTFHLLLINCDSHQELQSHKKSKRLDQSAHSDKLSQKTPQIATTKQERKCWIASVSFELALVTVRKTRRQSNSSVTLNRFAYPCVDTLHKVDNSRKLPTNTEECASGRDAVLPNEFTPNREICRWHTTRFVDFVRQEREIPKRSLQRFYISISI